MDTNKHELDFAAAGNRGTTVPSYPAVFVLIGVNSWF